MNRVLWASVVLLIVDIALWIIADAFMDRMTVRRFEAIESRLHAIEHIQLTDHPEEDDE